ncbi:hypothetical protein QVD17_11427 [Tagetes erecta]|uniref:Uncharacterized protein n=1 Tax=Tagetes erecta TaxID=13708 RepID=A0AAD8KXX6_TARER|nr:hypothetical protein QVD17_11427 [Tagetes erecta]
MFDLVMLQVDSHVIPSDCPFHVIPISDIQLSKHLINDYHIVKLCYSATFPYSVESDLVALTTEAKEKSKIRPKSLKFLRRNKRRPVARPSGFN